MARNPRIKYLTIGGGSKGYNEKIFSDFLATVEQSQFRERFVVKGWIPNDLVALYFAEADCGISIDRPVYEAETGSRNRILHFLAHGLRVASTGVCEFVRDLIGRGFVEEFTVGDPESLADSLVRLASEDRGRGKRIVDEARSYIFETYSFKVTMSGFLEWLDSGASRAPDNRIREAGVGALNEIERVLHPQKIQPQPHSIKTILKHLIR